MASNKIKGFVSNSKVSVDDVKARMKYQSLIEDYEELQKEFIERQSRLEAEREKKRILAAEVRFLRRKYRLLTMTEDTTRSSQEQPLIPSSTCVKQTRSAEKHTIDREETDERVLASGSVSKPKKRCLVSQQKSLVAIYLEKKSREGHKSSFWTRIVPKLLSKASFGP